MADLKRAENGPAVKYDRELDVLDFLRGEELETPGTKFAASLEISSTSWSLETDKVLRTWEHYDFFFLLCLLLLHQAKGATAN
jgi:hypothetical protein